MGQIGPILDELAIRFGATGAQLWGELVRLQIVYGWVLVAFAVVFGGLSLSALVTASRSRYDSDWYGSLGAVLLVVALVCGAWGVINLTAPEAMAIKSLLP